MDNQAAPAGENNAVVDEDMTGDTTEAEAATAAAAVAEATAARAAMAAAELDDMFLRVAQSAREIQPASTRKSYGPIKIEFKAFCQYKYEDDDEEPPAEHELITNEKKLFKFLY
jgi:hypothetical protein